MLVLPVLISIIITYVIWKVLEYMLWAIRAHWMVASVPGVSNYPVVGGLLLFSGINSTKDVMDRIISMCNIYMDKKEKIFKVWIGKQLFIMVANAQYIETILSSQDALVKDRVYEYLERWIGGIFSRNGPSWREYRKPLNKIMTKQMVESNVTVFHEKAFKLSNILSKFAGSDETVNIRHYLSNYAADALAISSFGYELNELDNDKLQLFYTLDSGIHIIMKMVVKAPYNMSITFSKYSPLGRKLYKLGETLRQIAYKLVEGRLKSKQKLGENIDDKAIYFSDILLQKSKSDNLNADAIGRIAADFFGAGFDTSAVVGSTILMLLAIYPEHQNAAYKELIDLLGDNISISPTWEQLSNMPYITRVIKETLRLFGPPNIVRTLTNDIELGEHKIPKGASIDILFLMLHRDPRYWSHPDQFYPDHFLPEESATRPKSAYYPFSWGPRSCPGKLYGMTSLKVLLSVLIRKYEFETDLKFEEIKYEQGLLLEFEQSYHLRMKPRKT